MGKTTTVSIDPPAPGATAPTRKSYDFESMQVGASMFFETEKEAKSAIAAAHNYAKKHCPGFRLVRRKIHGGIRVWRSE